MEWEKTRELAERLNPGETDNKAFIHVSRKTAKAASDKLYDTAIKEKAEEENDV